MMKLETRFVDFIPDQIQEKILYVSMEFGTVIHSCACGCGNEVNTPLGPNEWHLHYDGDVISLSPSVGNWSFPCKSHYWIKKGNIVWASTWDDDQIEEVRNAETLSRLDYYIDKQLQVEDIMEDEDITVAKVKPKKRSWLSRIFDWIW